MYTSCGWFFDDIGGIETLQVIQYAGRVVQLSEELFGPGLESRSSTAGEGPVHIPEHGNGPYLPEIGP